MNIWTEMMTALRGGMDELGETMKTSQAIEILKIQIKKSELILQEYKQALADTLVNLKQTEQQVLILQTEINKYEGYAMKALAQDDEELALEVSEHVALLENELDAKQASIDHHKKESDSIRQSIRIGEQEKLRMQQQLDTIRANETVHKAQQTMSETVNGTTKIHTATEVLTRLKQKQAKTLGKDGKISLKSKLLQAGIIDENEVVDEQCNDVTANEVLEKLKSKVN